MVFDWWLSDWEACGERTNRKQTKKGLTMTRHETLMKKYKKLEEAANRTASSIYASNEDRQEAWNAVNKVWEQIQALKKTKRVQR